MDGVGGSVETLWRWLAAGGGTVALTFIVFLALGILALTVFYVGSAVVVLERFARSARLGVGVFAFGVGVAAMGAALAVRSMVDEAPALSWPDWLVYFRQAIPGMLGATTAAMGTVALLLRFLAPAKLGTFSLILLGAALGAWVGATGVVLYALTLSGSTLGVALALAWRRRRRAPDTPADGPERSLRWLSAAFAVGIPVAFVAPETSPAIATAATGITSIFFGVVMFGVLPLAAAGVLAMRSSVEWFIATRYLVAKRRQIFISAITGICVAGIAAGVWLIIVVLSVMNGFEKTWREEIVGNRAHFTVHHGFGSFEDYEGVLEVVRSVDGVVGASPYLDAEGMVRGERGEIFSVRVRGIDPTSVGNVTDLREDLISGSLDALLEPEAGEGEATTPSPSGIVIGNQLAVSMNVRPGDNLLLISPYGGAPTPLGPAPRLKRFRVVGVFESSFFQYDEVFTYVNLPVAQDFRRSGDVIDGIEARTTDFYRSQRVAELVRARIDYPFFTRDWKEFFPAFFQALKTERVMMFILLTMIMVVAGFVIVATLIMMIMEKSSDIAILKAMGAEDGSIERIFALEGALIGLAGTGIGVIAGIAVTSQLAWIQEQVERITGIDTLPASVYQFSTLPSEIDPVQVTIVAVIAMILSLGATLLPSRQGARLDPAEALRYE